MSFVLQDCYFWVAAQSEARTFSKRGIAKQDEPDAEKVKVRKRLNFRQVEDIYDWKHLSLHVSREDDRREPTQEELKAKAREKLLTGMGDEFVQWFALNNERVLERLKPALLPGDVVEPLTDVKLVLRLINEEAEANGSLVTGPAKEHKVEAIWKRYFRLPREQQLDPQKDNWVFFADKGEFRATLDQMVADGLIVIEGNYKKLSLVEPEQPEED